MKRNFFDISKITTFVLDEADEMLDKSGLGDSSLEIRKRLKPSSCLVLLFSATFEKENIKDFALTVVPKPRGRIELKTVEELKVEKIQQLFLKCKDNKDRLTVLTKLYTYMTIGQVIIFVAMRATAQMIQKHMEAQGLKVSLLHGQGMDVNVRDSVIDKFREGKTRFLITTNVLSRGIDILNINLVINYDLPVIYSKPDTPDYDNYIHRIGRTGRFGRSGIALNFIFDNNSRNILKKIEEHFKLKIEEFPTDNLEHLDTLLKQHASVNKKK